MPELFEWYRSLDESIELRGMGDVMIAELNKELGLNRPLKYGKRPRCPHCGQAIRAKKQ